MATSPDRLWAAADAVERAGARAWLQALRSLKLGIDGAAVAAELAAGNTASALALLRPADQVRLLYAMLQQMGPLRALGWASTTQAVGVPTFVALATYASQRPEVLTLIRDHALARTADLAGVAGTTARQVLAEGLRTGTNPRVTARLLVDSIGLHPRQAAAVGRVRARLLAGGASNVEAQVGRYAERQLRTRAETIARTESMQALNEGNRLALAALQADGKLPPGEWEREWVTAPDERVCPECEPLDGARAPIGGMFPTGALGPPLHPRCRCVERLVVVDQAAG